MIITPPRYLKRKPTGSVRVLDPAIRGAWLYFNKSNLVYGQKPILTNGSVRGNGNLITQSGDESAQLELNTEDRLWPHFKPFTWFIRLKLLPSPNSTQFDIFGNINLSATNYVRIFCKSNGSNYSIRTDISVGSLTLVGSYIVPFDEIFNIVLTKSDDGAYSLHAIGEITSGSEGTEAEIYNRHGSRYHRITEGGNAFTEIESLYISHRHTSDNEVKELSRDPYSLFRSSHELPSFVESIVASGPNTPIFMHHLNQQRK